MTAKGTALRSKLSALTGSLLMAYMPLATADDPVILPSVDQNYIISPVTIGYSVSLAQSLSQTFTVGRTGSLHRVELQVSKNTDDSIAPLNVDILSTLPDGSPDYSSVLASVQLDSSMVTDLPFTIWLATVEFAEIPVNAGDRLAIALSAETIQGGGRYFWATHEPQDGNSYLGGDLFAESSDPIVGHRNLGPADAGFRTFVYPIPEPAAGLLAGAGLIAAAFTKRYRRVIRTTPIPATTHMLARIERAAQSAP
jgi:hypothetical protein